jgi:PAS domain S-box-containing protein
MNDPGLARPPDAELPSSISEPALEAPGHDLAEGENQFRSIFWGAADAMLVLDGGRVIVEANSAACGLFGAGAHQVVGRRLDALVVDGDNELPDAWRELLALGVAQREHRVRTLEGATRLVECSYRAWVQGGTGEGGRHLCIARDITARRVLDERLMQAQKIESIGRLAGGIAHDFNNLLTAILGYTELLLADRTDGDPVRHDLEEIRKAGQRAASLTQQLLAFSRRQVLLPKDVDLNQAVTGLHGMLSRLIGADIALTCDLAPTPAIIRVDPAQLEQAIVNLVLNARDALPHGGEIRLDVAQLPRTRLDLPPEQASSSDDYVRLRVSDNGVGIPTAVRPHLFEPFFTTKALGKGTGLGLASVDGIVRQSNGFITVESEPGAGSVFAMHFPVVKEVAVSGTPPSVKRRGSGHETILLVEDEDAVRAVISAVLRRGGYTVLEATGSRAAIDIFSDRGGEIDLLLTDVVMPDMSGPRLAERLMGLRPGLRVLLISGYADLAQPDGGNANVSFLGKPFQASALTARVKQILAPGRFVQPGP